MSSNELTAQQKRFVDEYLIDLNARQAAIRSGYSERTATGQASRLLTIVNVRKAVDIAMKRRVKRTEITQDRVLEELAKIGFSDIRNAVRWGRDPIDTTSENADPNGLNMYPVHLIPSEEISDDVAATISEVSLTTAGVKIKTYDKLVALKEIARHQGMIVERKEISGPGGAPIQTEGTVVDLATLNSEELAAYYREMTKNNS